MNAQFVRDENSGKGVEERSQGTYSKIQLLNWIILLGKGDVICLAWKYVSIT